MKRIIALSTIILSLSAAFAQKTELLPFGDFNSWVTRDIKESRILGGKTKHCYAIGPTTTIEGDKPYVNMGGSPWATSNVMAKVMGLTKVSNVVYPEDRAPGNRCAKLSTSMEHCKAMGMVDVDVVVAGTIFLGQMIEPISSTSNPYQKMEMGIPFTKRPKALCYDYRLEMPANGVKTYSSGFGKQKEIPGADHPEVFIILQRRWEDAEGNIHAKRVGTGRELIMKDSPEWSNKHELDVHYGNISGEPYYKSEMALKNGQNSYYARNSKGEMVPVSEEGWDSADATPTHLLVMFSSGSGEPYTGTIGTNFYVDNVALVY